MDPVQIYETTIYNRDGGSPFTFITVPGRSVIDGIESTDPAGIAEQLGMREPRFAEGQAIRITPAEAWALLFLSTLR